MLRAAFLFSSGLFILLGMPSVAFAATDKEMFRASDRVVVPPGETVNNDLYAAGESVSVMGVVEGDVVAFARNVVVAGTIRGDLWAAAQTIEIRGEVEGDIRAAGERLSITRSVGRNIVGFANAIAIEPEAVVGGDVTAYSGTLRIDGNVQGDVSGEVGTFVLEGSVGGRQAVRISPEDDSDSSPGIGDWMLARAHLWASIALVGGVLGLFWRRRVVSLAASVTERPIATFGYGLAAVVGILAALLAVLFGVVLVAVILGIVRLGGLVAFSILAGLLVEGALLVGAVFVATLLAGVLVSLAGGRLVLERYTAGRRFTFLIWLGVGAAIFSLLQGVPYAGGLVALVAAMLSLGAVARWLWSFRRGREEPGHVAGEAG